MGSLDALVANLSPAQRERLARIQSDPRTRAALTHEARVKSAAAQPDRVEAHARVELDGSVLLHAKGLRLINVANAREPWQVRRRRVEAEHQLVNGALAPLSRPAGPWLVTITREGRALMDSDGLAISAKGVRDAVATWLGVDDGPSGPVTWAYDQHKAKGYGVMVKITGGAR